MKNLDLDESTLSKLKHLRLPAVSNLIDCSQRSWLRWVKNGDAPRPIRLGAGVVAWQLLDLQNWLESKKEDSKK